MTAKVVQFPGRPAPQETKHVSRIQSAAALASVPDYPSVHRWHADPDAKQLPKIDYTVLCVMVGVVLGLAAIWGWLFYEICVHLLPLIHHARG